MLNTTLKSYNSFLLLAVPFFLLTANLMNVGGITEKLVTLSRTMVGNFPGPGADQRAAVDVLRRHLGLVDGRARRASGVFIAAQVKEGYDLRSRSRSPRVLP